MSSTLIPRKQPGRNRIALVRQNELYIIGLGRLLNRQHQSHREAITNALIDGAQVQSGSLSAAIVQTPREWTLRSVAGELMTAESANVVQHAPVTECVVLRINSSMDVEPTMFTLDDVAPGGMIPQSVLRRYLDQVPMCREIQNVRNRVVQRLSDGASIERGDLDAVLEIRRLPSYSRAVFVSALGEIRCSAIERAIGPLTRRRLVLRDSAGQPLGWHAAGCTDYDREQTGMAEGD